MKVYVSRYAPNPRRVQMFIAEKAIAGIEEVMIDLMKSEHRSDAYLAKNPFGRTPALELDDGRVLTETRAICTYLEGLYPQPNLMGEGFEERAFIEMADRRAELMLFQQIANSVRHTHPALAVLEQPQFAEYGASQGEKMLETARWFDSLLAGQPYIAGERFTIADITAFCGLEFARGMMKFVPGQVGMENLQAWRDRIAARPSVGRP
ncbi:glutathione S-transferase family protein [Massilia horti]|uniref:Glutathione S-transferase family protein n=1 Tax=Massilia horti TaxID=2562153 RepID=A0A4Y9T9T9_9BURK|nr:glutathione S-transferase family protein [Massilia horti]TFW34846.1 glutathione S-transferase family protein [Massilia horti]